ncbi:MAG: hypothetical protein JHC95_00570 [Solirubrobacteraceae bacterium]|nr:hypothetical protein [Solirubrobacteraceae bacterium]
MRTAVKPPPEEVFEVFGEAAFVESVTPRFMRLRVRQIGLAVGDKIDVEFRVLFRIRWVSTIVSEERAPDAIRFVDERVGDDATPWPLATWQHHHGFLRSPSGGTIIVDAPQFTVRPRILAPIAYPLLWFSFVIRKGPYRRRFGSS